MPFTRRKRFWTRNWAERPPNEPRNGRRRDGRRKPDALIYDVRDNGTGLSAEAAERLRDGLFTTKKDGTGFGLLGTRKALLEMGGRLLWENLPDSGALFRIVLPLRVERTPAAAEANHLREDS